MFRTKYKTTGTLSNGGGRFHVVEVPAGVICSPIGNGAFYAEGWREWGGPDLAGGTLGDWDAEHRGIVLQGVHVEEVPA